MYCCVYCVYSLTKKKQVFQWFTTEHFIEYRDSIYIIGIDSEKVIMVCKRVKFIVILFHLKR